MKMEGLTRLGRRACMLVMGVICATAEAQLMPAQYEQAKLTAADAAADDYFGRAVAISGSYAIVGAPQDDDGAMDAGSAYVFRRDGASWAQQDKLVASDGARIDHFGEAVSISNDWAIVGAPCADAPENSAGAAYIFRRQGDDWVEVQKLTDPVPNLNGYFGASVSIHGDRAIVAGDFRHVHVYERDNDTWTRVAELAPSDPHSGVCFGHSVAISDDYAIVGSRNDFRGTGTWYTGSAYIFQRNEGIWSQMAKILAWDRSGGDEFGESVAITEDFAVVGAWKDDDAGSDSGSAYVFRRDGASWVSAAKLTASNGAPGDNFGTSVSIHGSNIAVGAYDRCTEAGGAGAAYWFQAEDPTSWKQMGYLLPSDPTVGTGIADYTGWRVSTSDGYAVVGSMYHDDGLRNSGAAYVFAVPEPATLGLLALGGLILSRRKRRV